MNCNKANCVQGKYTSFSNMYTFYGTLAFPCMCQFLRGLCVLYILMYQSEGLLRPYQYYDKGVNPAFYTWLVCLSEWHHGDRQPVLLGYMWSSRIYRPKYYENVESKYSILFTTVLWKCS